MTYVLENKDKKPEKRNPVDAFFSGIVAIGTTMKSPYYQNLAKQKVFAVVSKLEMQHIMNQVSTTVTITQSNCSQSYPTTATPSDFCAIFYSNLSPSVP